MPLSPLDWAFVSLRYSALPNLSFHRWDWSEGASNSSSQFQIESQRREDEPFLFFCDAYLSLLIVWWLEWVLIVFVFFIWTWTLRELDQDRGDEQDRGLSDVNKIGSTGFLRWYHSSLLTHYFIACVLLVCLMKLCGCFFFFGLWFWKRNKGNE